MKTHAFPKILALGALLCLFIMPVAKAKAQSAMYIVHNLLNCDVKIEFETLWRPLIYCNEVCSGGVLTIPAGSDGAFFYSPPCGCDIKICVLQINGIDVAGVCNTIGLPPTSGSAPPNCSSTGNVRLHLNGDEATIYP